MELLRLRKEKNLTQRQVAQALNIFPQVYSRYERNEYEPSFELLCKLADFFEVSVDELLGRTHAPQLFDDARIEPQLVVKLYNQLTPHQQDLIMERMQAYIETNKEHAALRNQTAQIIWTPQRRTDDEC